uniref:Uncharacterized protein n=1 Tax=Lepeophtheirus salmonis TaxID=72036 RepID=A0A0K2V0H5_LEPSM
MRHKYFRSAFFRAQNTADGYFFIFLAILRIEKFIFFFLKIGHGWYSACSWRMFEVLPTFLTMDTF